MDPLSPEERLHLNSLIGESQYEDNTANIRRLKHSIPLRLDTCKIVQFQHERDEGTDEQKARTDEEFRDYCIEQCPFMFSQYPDIFNRLVKNTLDVVTFYKMLIVLKLIEDEAIDQHQGSLRVGQLLKELFLDSAQREERLRSDQRRLAKENNGGHAPQQAGDGAKGAAAAAAELPTRNYGKPITYAEFRKQQQQPQQPQDE